MKSASPAPRRSRRLSVDNSTADVSGAASANDGEPCRPCVASGYECSGWRASGFVLGMITSSLIMAIDVGRACLCCQLLGKAENCRPHHLWSSFSLGKPSKRARPPPLQAVQPNQQTAMEMATSSARSSGRGPMSTARTPGPSAMSICSPNPWSVLNSAAANLPLRDERGERRPTVCGPCTIQHRKCDRKRPCSQCVMSGRGEECRAQGLISANSSSSSNSNCDDSIHSDISHNSNHHINNSINSAFSSSSSGSTAGDGACASPAQAAGSLSGRAGTSAPMDNDSETSDTSTAASDAVSAEAAAAAAHGACTACAAAHRSCDRQRPCRRCIKNDKADRCRSPSPSSADSRLSDSPAPAPAEAGLPLPLSLQPSSHARSSERSASAISAASAAIGSGALVGDSAAQVARGREPNSSDSACSSSSSSSSSNSSAAPLSSFAQLRLSTVPPALSPLQEPSLPAALSLDPPPPVVDNNCSGTTDCCCAQCFWPDPDLVMSFAPLNGQTELDFGLEFSLDERPLPASIVAAIRAEAEDEGDGATFVFDDGDSLSSSTMNEYESSSSSSSSSSSASTMSAPSSSTSSNSKRTAQAEERKHYKQNQKLNAKLNSMRASRNRTRRERDDWRRRCESMERLNKQLRAEAEERAGLIQQLTEQLAGTAYFLKATGGTIKLAVRDFLANAVAKHNVSLLQAGPLLTDAAKVFGHEVADSLDSQSAATRSIAERSFLERCHLALSLASSLPVAIYTDATSTFFGTSVFCVRVLHEGTSTFATLKQLNTGKAAPDLLDAIRCWVDETQQLQQWLKIEPSKWLYLHRVEAVCSDNESANTGKKAGLLAEIEKARHDELKVLIDKASSPEAKAEFSKRLADLPPLQFYSCHVHISNIVVQNFSRRLREIERKLLASLPDAAEHGQRKSQSFAHFLPCYFSSHVALTPEHRSFLSQACSHPAKRQRVLIGRFFSIESCGSSLAETYDLQLRYLADMPSQLTPSAERTLVWMREHEDYLRFIFRFFFVSSSTFSRPFADSASNRSAAQHREYCSELFHRQKELLEDENASVRDFAIHYARAVQLEGMQRAESKVRKEQKVGERPNGKQRRSIGKARAAVPSPLPSSFSFSPLQKEVIRAWRQTIVDTFNKHLAQIVNPDRNDGDEDEDDAKPAGADPINLKYTNICSERILSTFKRVIERNQRTRIGLVDAILRVRDGEHTLAAHAASPLAAKVSIAAILQRGRDEAAQWPTPAQRAKERFEAMQEEEQAERDRKQRALERQQQQTLELLKRPGGKVQRTERSKPQRLPAGQRLSPELSQCLVTFKWNLGQLQDQLRLRNLHEPLLQQLRQRLPKTMFTRKLLKLGGKREEVLARMQAVLGAEKDMSAAVRGEPDIAPADAEGKAAAAAPPPPAEAKAESKRRPRSASIAAAAEPQPPASKRCRKQPHEAKAKAEGKDEKVATEQKDSAEPSRRSQRKPKRVKRGGTWVIEEDIDAAVYGALDNSDAELSEHQGVEEEEDSEYDDEEEAAAQAAESRDEEDEDDDAESDWSE